MVSYSYSYSCVHIHILHYRAKPRIDQLYHYNMGSHPMRQKVRMDEWMNDLINGVLGHDYAL